MTMFESEIQELVYGILAGDTLVAACLGADASDGRIGLSFGDSETRKISAERPAYIVIETMPAPAPVRLGSGIDERTERYCLHVYTKPERRDLRAAVVERFRELFHGRSFVTARFIVFRAFEGAGDGSMTDAGLFDYRYTLSFECQLKRGY